MGQLRAREPVSVAATRGQEEVAQGVLAPGELAAARLVGLREREAVERLEEPVLAVAEALRFVGPDAAAEIGAGKVEDAGRQIDLLLRDQAPDLDAGHRKGRGADVLAPAEAGLPLVADDACA